MRQKDADWQTCILIIHVIGSACPAPFSRAFRGKEGHTCALISDRSNGTSDRSDGLSSRWTGHGRQTNNNHFIHRPTQELKLNLMVLFYR